VALAAETARSKSKASSSVSPSAASHCCCGFESVRLLSRITEARQVHGTNPDALDCKTAYLLLVMDMVVVTIDNPDVVVVVVVVVVTKC